MEKELRECQSVKIESSGDGDGEDYEWSIGRLGHRFVGFQSGSQGNTTEASP